MLAKFEPEGPAALVADPVVNNIPEFNPAPKAAAPLLKVAYIDASVFAGDNQLDALAALKSKNELIGDIIGLLQSPAKNVIGALKSSGGKLAGIVKTLSERPE